MQRHLSVPKTEHGAGLRITSKRSRVSAIRDNPEWWGPWQTGELGLEGMAGTWLQPLGAIQNWGGEVSSSSDIFREVGSSSFNVKATAFYRLARIVSVKCVSRQRSACVLDIHVAGGSPSPGASARPPHLLSRAPRPSPPRRGPPGASPPPMAETQLRPPRFANPNPKWSQKPG